MTLKFGVMVPQGWRMDLADISDPVEAYETMTRVAQEAEVLGFHSVWLYDHFHTIPVPSQEVTFECWMSTAALIGTPGSMRKRLVEYEEAGVQELILWFPDAAKLESLRLFAREFIQS